jgi:hypothetical protein
MTDIVVQPAGEVASETPEVLKETPLLSLKKRRQDLVEKLHIDLKVPRWGDDGSTPEIFVRYGPVDSSRLEKAVDVRRKINKDEWSILANADILTISCLGVYACLDGNYENKYSLDPAHTEHPSTDPRDWTKFDERLRENLGFTPGTAPTSADICRTLYLTDGDLLAAATELFEWSSISTEKLDEDFTSP